MKKNIFILALICLWFSNNASAQEKVLNMPLSCIDPFTQDFKAILELQKAGVKKNTPWIVYSERGADFGQKYYVTREEGENVYICIAQGVEGNKLIGASKPELRPKSELVVKLSAELLEKAIIHKKCVVLNKDTVLKEILKGNLSEANIPLFKSPTAATPYDSIPLYFMYFVYKTEKGRYLIGRDYDYDQTMAFEDQIFGWVDAIRVYEYDTRICFEPNYERHAVAERRCNPALSAKVYQNWDEDKQKFVGAKVWEEPANFYLFKSDGVTDSAVIKEKIDKLCLSPDKPDFSLFEVEYLPGLKFRFPLIQAKNDNVFWLGCTGRYDESRMIKDERCKNLEENKRNLNLSLIVDQELKITKSAFFLEQINSKGKEYSKQFGVCFFPRPVFGDQRLAVNNSYEQIRDYIKYYVPEEELQKDDNCLITLDYILNKENELNPLETNVFILLNASKVPTISETSDLYKRLLNNIVNKNCYIIAFDYAANSGLIPLLKDLMTKAAKIYAKKYNISVQPSFVVEDNIHTLENTGILAVIGAGKPGSLSVSQVEAFIPVALEDILKTINDAITFVCAKNNGNVQRRESPFAKVISDLEQNSVVLSVRAMEQGYSQMEIKGKAKYPTWKAEVLMTDRELQELISLMGQYSKVGVSADEKADKICELWIKISNRFVGQKLSETELLDKTPQEVMQKMVGGYFGYSDSGVLLKKYTLRSIRERDPAAERLFDSYISHVNRSKADLEKIRDSKSLEFKNLRDDREEKSNISYFWIPIDKLP